MVLTSGIKDALPALHGAGTAVCASAQRGVALVSDALGLAVVNDGVVMLLDTIRALIDSRGAAQLFDVLLAKTTDTDGSNLACSLGLSKCSPRLADAAQTAVRTVDKHQVHHSNAQIFKIGLDVLF